MVHDNNSISEEGNCMLTSKYPLPEEAMPISLMSAVLELEQAAQLDILGARVSY